MIIHRNKQQQYHRLDGPAIEYPTGRKEWWVNGVLHRKDGPAITNKNGTVGWYYNGKSHRLDGPAVEYSWGGKEWHINGIEYDSYLEYLVAVDEYKQNQLTNYDNI